MEIRSIERKLVEVNRMAVSIIFRIIIFGMTIYFSAAILVTIMFSVFQTDLFEYKELILLISSFAATWLSINSAFKKETMRRDGIKKIMQILIILYIVFFCVSTIPEYFNTMSIINDYGGSKDVFMMPANISLLIGIGINLASIFMAYKMLDKRVFD